MTANAEHPSSNGGDNGPKPAASLAEIEIRRREAGDRAANADKPGDLTSMLSNRRPPGAAPEDTPEDRPAAPNGPHAGPGGEDTDGDRAATENMSPAARGGIGGAPPAARAGVTTLRQRIVAEREGRRAGAPAAPDEGQPVVDDPSETRENGVEAARPPDPEPASHPRAREAVATVPPPADAAEPLNAESATSLANRTEAPDAKSAFPVPAPRPAAVSGAPSPDVPVEAEEPGPDDAAERKLRSFGRLRRDRRREEAEEETGEAFISDDVLRKRMAAVLRAESRRREQWAAKRGERTNVPDRETALGQAQDSAQDPDAAAVEDHPAAAPPPRRTPPAKPGDIARYWSSARRGRPLPALSELDLDEIAGHWPDTLLLRFATGSRHLELERSLTRTGPGDPRQAAPERKIDYTPVVIDWVVHQGLLVARDGNPVRATEEFDTDDGVARYSVVALPLGEDGETIDHILCHLEPA